MHLFAEHGYAAVTMRALGGALGVSAMTTYRYIAGKAELFVLVRAEAFRRFADALVVAAAEAPEDDPVRRLFELKRAYVAFALAQPDAYRMMFELRGDTEPPKGPARDELAAESRRAFGCLHACVADAIERGALEGDALIRARLFWASTHGLVSLYLAGQLGKDQLEVLAREQWELGAALERSPRPPRRKPQKRKKRKP